jgi:predicted transcriptional regulator
MELELKRRAMLEEVLEAVGSGKRLATIEQITQGVPAKDIHKNIDASRSGVQHFVNDFKDAGLITAEDGQYELTTKGEVMVQAISELDKEFEQFEREQIRELTAQSSLSIEEIKQIVEESRQE